MKATIFPVLLWLSGNPRAALLQGPERPENFVLTCKFLGCIKAPRMGTDFG